MTRAVVCFALSVVAFGVGVLYTAEPSRQLPAFLPGHMDSSLHQISYAVICGFLSVVLFFAGCINLVINGPWREQPARPFRDGHPVHPIRSLRE